MPVFVIVFSNLFRADIGGLLVNNTAGNCTVLDLGSRLGNVYGTI
ncbi:hypothetical protein [Chryseobacterium koreense]